MKKKNNNKRKWNWKLTETIDSMLTEEEISNLINRKLAYIIVELEHSPASYINTKKTVSTCCNSVDDTV